MPPRAPVERPEGLAYRPEILSGAEERELLARLRDIDLDEVHFRGVVAKRTVKHYGYAYDYESWGVTPADPVPAFLLPLRARCGELAEVPAEELAEALVQRYPPGATIGWHRDATAFGPKVVGVSLGAAARMRFQRGKGEARRVFDLELEPRSAYVLAGAARSAWQHSTAPAKDERWSVTFRTVRPSFTG